MWDVVLSCKDQSHALKNYRVYSETAAGSHSQWGTRYATFDIFYIRTSGRDIISFIEPSETSCSAAVLGPLSLSMCPVANCAERMVAAATLTTLLLTDKPGTCSATTEQSNLLTFVIILFTFTVLRAVESHLYVNVYGLN